MVVSVAESLSKFGFNPKEGVFSKDSFSQQLESYALHVIEDKPVSNAYSYFIANSEIYIDRDRSIPLHVDLEERGGLAAFGTRKAVSLAQAFPGNIICFYSPPGPVAFETGTKYDLLKPYPDGQLYLLVGNGRGQIDSIAISISKDNEKKVLETFLGKDSLPGGFDTEIEKIKYYLTNPFVSGFDPDSLLRRLNIDNNFPVYRNIHNQVFCLSDIVFYLRDGWLKEIKPEIRSDYEELYRLAELRGAKRAYLQLLTFYFPIYGQDGKMVLGGGCGGAVVAEESLSFFDPMIGIKQQNPLSTGYRLQTTTIKDILKNNSERYEDYKCPGCGTIHQGEIKGGDSSTWVKKCSCGFKFSCN